MTEIDRDKLFERLRAAQCLTGATRGIGGRRGWHEDAGQVFAFLSIMEPHLSLQKRIEIADAVARNRE